jgi:hypothetical protein
MSIIERKTIIRQTFTIVICKYKFLYFSEMFSFYDEKPDVNEMDIQDDVTIIKSCNLIKH